MGCGAKVSSIWTRRQIYDEIATPHVHCERQQHRYVLEFQKQVSLATNGSRAMASSANSSQPVRQPATVGKPDRLYVGNLSSTIDEYTLLQVFSKYGKITRLDVMYHKTGPQKGKPRGYAFIEYSNKDVSCGSHTGLQLTGNRML